MFLDAFLGRERFKTPSTPIGIGGFSLFARVRERVELKSTIPTNYVEDGTPLNDHIILDPEILTIEGMVGDVYRGQNTILLQALPLNNTLGIISAYLPRTTGFQAVVMNKLKNTTAAAMNRINDLIGIGNQINNLMGNLDVSSKPLPEQFIDAMENLRYGKQLITIDMPYRTFDNMVITGFTYDRDNTTSTALSFSITAQRFRMAQTTVSEVSNNRVARADKNPAPSVAGQTKDVKDIGSQTGIKRERSFLSTYNPF